MAVYLIHLNEKLGNPSNVRAQAGHYLGYAKNVKRRVAEHQSGQGARLLAAANERGISYEVVRVWPEGDRTLERKLKNRKQAKVFCPVCTQTHAVHA